MKSHLQSLFQAINQATGEDEFRARVAPKIGEHFAATRSGIFFFDRILAAERNLNPAFKKAIETVLSTERNPIARYLAEQHAPVHESLVTSPKAWQIICPRPDHWHVMAGPVVTQGQLIGVLGCTREKSQPNFNNQNLADMSAICLHLSVWAATVRIQQSPNFAKNSVDSDSMPLSARLTARERQIADLVSLGKKNAEVGAELWITENSVKQALKKIFRKLEVSSRTEMATRLSAERQLQ
ncbi:LuxR family transcriptional regulator [filamentous cyanobacterium LEGE 11480]|uniref:LuxR family transcriptional regulator n=1 Tax=Romeriopsis navalis LEGE 11480 TaxID=2777977 RepID=A0A928VSG0_9CYAN|nr:LuxR C-terminal-related transcriptional regulator [Romeriopsis navalis]MBE9031364.1 LuxR family transcriptional regulator [Romeriopsis navalis LEGE 11480]